MSSQSTEESKISSAKRRYFIYGFFCASIIFIPLIVALQFTLDIIKEKVSAITSRDNNPISASGYTPEVRCQEISARFQHYHEQGKLRYISTSKMNGYPILCVADRMLGSCLENSQGKAILLTLKPEDNVEQTLQELLVIRDTASSPMTQFIAKDFHGESMMQFTAKDLQGNIFVDLEKYITALIKEGKIDASELEIDRINTSRAAD